MCRIKQRDIPIWYIGQFDNYIKLILYKNNSLYKKKQKFKLCVVWVNYNALILIIINDVFIF